ncbi:hypothetical protein GCM10011579_027600 [Streptomyces albiflavescens]|uniref:Uncharacterized protein n=1 Tax=Streptomyces albiflavescens TaxID=1623582 RepID=A0A917Y058_9ACTN|nr:hypothetical protein GCM10011579_027600 [Streptomyces albiflavescens]
MPPWLLTQRAYALAIAGMPGLFVAAVFSGAQVMTVTGSPPEPPVAPGTTPHPTAIDAHAASAPADSNVALTGRGRMGELVRVRRLPVMDKHDSVTSPTQE